VDHPPLSSILGITEAKKEIEVILLMSMVQTLWTLTTPGTKMILGRLIGMRRLATKQTGTPLTPPMHTLRRLFSVKRKLRTHKGLGALAGAQTMIKLTSMEHTLPIEHPKVLSNQVLKESACLAIAPRLDA
jgi:hypothetical protein